MTTEPLSPRRRHILSSINPEGRSASPQLENDRPTPGAPSPEPIDTEQMRDATEQARDATERKDRKRTKFRFKSSKHSRSSRHRDRDGDHQEDSSTSSHRHHRHTHRHHHHHHHHRHKMPRTRSRSPTPPNPFEPPQLGSDAAFRESLFDAMADDEGAAYWEGVYGQPIHVYGQERANPAGELERMGDDEYAAFVRQKMWEKTHQGLLEERARREEKRQRQERREEEATRLAREMERSLRRGEERRRQRSWKDRWAAYLERWAGWDNAPGGIAWPVESGRREDVDAPAVREFFVMGIDPVEVGEAEFLGRLKEERVRWHPDKIQQKLGGKVDEAVMRDVTAVFQIVDKLWSDIRAKAQ